LLFLNWVINYAAYHLILLGVCINFLYAVVSYSLTYYSLLLLYPAGIIFCFIFYSNTYLLIGYLIFFIPNEFVIIYYFSGVRESGDLAILSSEYVNEVAYNASIFAMCYFFLNNLKKYRLAFDNTKIEIEAQQKNTGNQKVELEHKNLQMSKYIESNLH